MVPGSFHAIQILVSVKKLSYESLPADQPNIKSAKKRVKVIEAKTLQNKAQKSALKTLVKKAELSLADAKADSTEIVREAIKRIDQAAAKGILHKNAASRKKSALASKLAR